MIRGMRPRDPDEAHRVATPLELLLDLCFVVAVAQASTALHHGLVEGHFLHTIHGYLAVFYALWWAWMNFTWFASAYDTDDVPYRLLVLLQIAGVLILAAGVPRAFQHMDFLVQTIGYVVMRVAMLAQWLRASRVDPDRRKTARRYAIGIGICQIGWVCALALPVEYYQTVGWLVLVPAELSVPIWAESAARTPWHPHHIGERYGLLTLIVLGESVLSATNAIQAAFDRGAASPELVSVIAGGVLIVFAMWWIYFDDEPHHFLRKTRSAPFLWGYGHYLIFASAAAVGAGLAVEVDHVTNAEHVSSSVAAASVAIPVASFLTVTWAVHLRPHGFGSELIVVPIAAVAVLGAILSPWPVLVIGAMLALMLGARLWLRSRRLLYGGMTRQKPEAPLEE